MTEWVAVALSGVAIVLTFYNFQTEFRFTRRVYREQVNPYVVVDLVPRAPESQMLCLSITNTGSTVARNVKVQIDPPLRTTLGSDQDARLERTLCCPISVMPPGRRVLYNVGLGSDVFAVLSPKYSVKVDAEGPFGAVETLCYEVDLNALKGAAVESETIVGQLMNIAGHLKGSKSR
ncbi:hypothetical protein [Streptomyces boncukensis]|uniref:Uncharacterized protein n=1 Tax=Streptomyces boncukensis TaxID=2711219 RepID=A0A6G4X453_9ACTN|nr:hypothetical protein [Streptomyces boncukensis]NGO71451.1 hypothetical protein [Streptomyces boncukensis]